MNKKTSSFIAYTKKELNKHKVTLRLSNTNKMKLHTSIFCSGFFDSENNILACATKKPLKKWLCVYVHEYGHFLQWKENSIYFDEENKENERYMTSDGIIDDWIGGKNYSQETIIKAIRSSQECELDCEKKAAKLIKKFDLPIDVGEYIQRANSYVSFYNYVLIRRKWYPQRSSPPYDIKKVKEFFPKRFINKFDTINMDFINCLDKEYKYGYK